MTKYIDLKNGFQKNLGLLTAGLAFVVYLLTLAPGVYGFDSAELSTGVHLLGIVHPSGYPLYLIFGKLFSYLPIKDLAYRLNVMSAFFGALTVYMLFILIQLVIEKPFFAAIASLFLAFSNYFWQMALIAEVYTLHTFLLSVNLFLLLLWQKSGSVKYLYGFAFIYGLSLSNHTSGVLFAPAFTWLVITSEYWHWDKAFKRILIMGGSCVIGMLPYIYLPIRALTNPSLNYVLEYYGEDLTTFEGVWWMISGKAYRFFAFAYTWGEIPGEMLRFLNYFWRNFMGIGVLIGVLGLVVGWKRDKKFIVGLIGVFLANAIFFINYRVLDKDTMFLPSYVIWAIFIAFGLFWLWEKVEKWVNSGLLAEKTKQYYAFFLPLVIAMTIGLNWKWVNLSNVKGPASFADEVMRTAEPNAVILAQWSPAVILEYTQLVNNERSDLLIYNRSRSQVAQFYRLWEKGWPRESIWRAIEEHELDLVRSEILHRPVYVVDYDPLFAREFEYLPEGNYFQLAPIE